MGGGKAVGGALQKREYEVRRKKNIIDGEKDKKIMGGGQ